MVVQVFVKNIPKDWFEDKLVPLFEPCGRIYDIRLILDPTTGYNKGFAFVCFCEKSEAQEAIKKVRRLLYCHLITYSVIKKTASPKATHMHNLYWSYCEIRSLFEVGISFILGQFGRNSSGRSKLNKKKY